MKVKILVEFEVETAAVDEDGDELELDERVAKNAAGAAAWDYLSFCTVSGTNTDSEKVTVHVDGFGECIVKLGEEHG